MGYHGNDKDIWVENRSIPRGLNWPCWRGCDRDQNATYTIVNEWEYCKYARFCTVGVKISSMNRAYYQADQHLIWTIKILIPVAAASTRSIESPPLAIVGDEVLEEISCILGQWRSHVINNFMALRPHFGLGAWLQSCKLRHAPRVSFRNCCERGRSAC